MRWGWLALAGLGLTACAQGDSLGSYRLPMPDGNGGVSLTTILAREDQGLLILFDTAQNKELGRGHADFSLFDSSSPFVFGVPDTQPLRLLVADGVLQDTANRPYQTVPLTPIDPGGASVRRVTLTSGSESLTLVTAGSAIFAEAAAAQPQLPATPSPLFLMNSVAGVGLALPPDFLTVTNWRDAMSTLVPANPRMTISCGAPLTSSTRTDAPTNVDVPAGHFSTIPLFEVIDTCDKTNPPALTIYRVDRWFASGVGPVRMTWTDSSSQLHEYRLVSSHLGSSHDAWPLEEGNSWTYEVRDGLGNVEVPSVTVSVSEVREVKPQ